MKIPWIMFADDTKIWKAVKVVSDQVSLQHDLDEIQKWTEKWKMGLNNAKCKVMHIIHNMVTKYYLKDNVNMM